MLPQHDPNPSETRFFSLVASQAGERGVRLMIESLRAFGGRLGAAPVWVFYWDGFRPDLDTATQDFAHIQPVHLYPLELAPELHGYLFSGKVAACAQAEALTGPDVRQIVWFAPDCLVIQPPDLFKLEPNLDAAFRPVHIRNVGLSVGQPLDEFWKGVYQAVGLEDTSRTVECFIDPQPTRPYFNSHIFAIDPGRRLMGRWLETFKALVNDQAFQQGACADELHQIFLHQAALSALLTKHLDWERLRLLPPEYSYPLHFHQRVPPSLRPAALNELVCIAYEELHLNPDGLPAIEVHEPLRSWLRTRFPA